MKLTVKQKKWVIMTVIIAVVVVGGYFSIKALLPQDTEVDAVKYSTAQVTRGDIKVGVDAVGNLSASYGGGLSVPWSEDTSGMSYKVADVYVKSGDQVKSGDPILQLSAPNLSEQIKDLQEQLNNERKSLADMLNLPIEEVDNADPSNGIIVTAPFDGRVVGLNMKVGTDIEDLTDSVRVVDDSVVKISAYLTAYEISKIKDGKTKAIVNLWQYLGDTREARITDVNRNPNTVASNTLYLDSGSKCTESGNEFIYNVTLELDNPGLVVPADDALTRVGFYEPAAGYTFKTGDIPDGTRWCRYSAIIESYADEEDVSSGLAGTITKVIAKNNSLVKEGDPIFAMAGSDVREDIQKRQDSIRTKKSQLLTYQMQAGNLLITAPCDGMVSDLQKKKGDSVSPGDWLGSVFNTSNMSMYVNVDDTDVLLVKQGAPVKVTVDALPETPFTGVVEQVSGMGTDEKGVSQFQVYISVQGSAGIREGMQARAYIDAGSASGVLLIPQEAVYTEGELNKVDVLNDDGTVSTVTIEIGLSNSTQVEVKSGLKEGQVVITGSTADMLPSQSTVTPGEPSADGSQSGEDSSGNGGGNEAPAEESVAPEKEATAAPSGMINVLGLILGYRN